MVSARCITAVKDALGKIGFHDIETNLGEVRVKDNISDKTLGQIRSALSQSGFELLEDKKNTLVQQIQSCIIEVVYNLDDPLAENLSVYLSNKLHKEYTYLTNLFSEESGITIERFFITHKIERVKELLVYPGLSLTDIAFKMNYCSVAHLSGQFKKVTGLTTSQFKQLKDKQHSFHTPGPE